MKTKIFVLLLSSFSLITFSQKQWTLKECVEEALTKNITIQQNKLSVELAKKDVDIAKGNFLPDLRASSNGTYTEGLSDNGSGTLANTKNFSSSLGLGSNGIIFNGFRNLITYKQAQLGIESSKLNLAVIENDITLFVVNNYLNVLFAKENLAAAKTQYEISKKQVEAAKERFKSGVIPKGDLLNSESTVASDLQNVITQENALDIAKLNLAQALQVPVQNFDIKTIDVGTPSVNLLFKKSDDVYIKALSTRPEIERSLLSIKNSDYNIEIAKGAFMPTVSYNLFAGSTYFHQFNNLDVFDPIGNLLFTRTNDNYFSQINDRFNYGATLSLSIPIFNRFQTKNRVTQAKINKKIAEYDLESEKLQLQQTIEQAFLDVKTALKTYEAAKVSLDAQQEAFKNAQESYNYGATSLFDFDLVRNRFVNAQATLIRSKYDYVFKTKVLEFYSGELQLN